MERDEKGRFIKGGKMTDEEKLALSERLKGHPGYTKGRKFTEEHKKKISDALKGKMPKNLKTLNVNKKGEGNPMWGKQASEKQKEAARKTCENRDYTSEEYRQKLSEAQKGEKGSNWQGGKTSINKTIRKGLAFKLWRESVFERDNYTCKKCNVIGGYLHPHHIHNFSNNIDLRFDIDNGITLCEKCHRGFHKIYKTKNNNQEQLNQYIYEHKN